MFKQRREQIGEPRPEPGWVVVEMVKPSLVTE
jgi:hypothetical protein